MEGAPSAKVFTGFRFGRWKKQSGYKRINDAACEPQKKRRFWKLSPRIKLRLNFRLRFSPKKFLMRLRDAYVNVMLRIANAPGVGAFAGDGVAGFGPRRFKEYDEKMLVQIYYKSLLMAQTPRDGNCCLPEAQSLVGPGPELGPAGPSPATQSSSRPNRSGQSRSGSPREPVDQPSGEPTFQPGQQGACLPARPAGSLPSSPASREPAFQPSGEPAYRPNRKPKRACQPAQRGACLPAQPAGSLPSSPAESLPTGPTGSLPFGLVRSLPSSLAESLPSSPMGSLPAGPTRNLPLKRAQAFCLLARPTCQPARKSNDQQSMRY